MTCQQAGESYQMWTENIQRHFKPRLDTLGAGSSDPFILYPIEVNSETRRLISYSE